MQFLYCRKVKVPFYFIYQFVGKIIVKLVRQIVTNDANTSNSHSLVIFFNLSYYRVSYYKDSR